MKSVQEACGTMKVIGERSGARIGERGGAAGGKCV